MSASSKILVGADEFAELTISFLWKISIKMDGKKNTPNSARRHSKIVAETMWEAKKIG